MVTGWKVTYNSKTINVTLAETRTVEVVFGALSESTLFVAEPIWTPETYQIKLVTNSTTTQTKGTIIDKTNLPVSEPATLTVTYGDVFRLTDITEGEISVWELSVYHVTNGTVNATPYISYRATASDVSWVFRNAEVYIGVGLTNDTLTSTNLDATLSTTDYYVGDLSDKTMFVKFNFNGNQLIQTYTVRADYAGDSNYAVQVTFEVVNNDSEGNESYVEVGTTTYTISGTYSHTFKNGDTFIISVPRDNSNSYVKVTMTACEGFYLKNGSSDVETYSVTYANITTHSTNTITAKLDILTIKVATNNVTWGIVTYNYTLKAVDADGFITQEDGATYTNANDETQLSSYTFEVPYFTAVSLHATDLPGHMWGMWTGTSTVSGNVCDFIVTQDTNYTASFRQRTFTCTFKINGVEFATSSGWHTYDDITETLEKYKTPTPAELDEAPYALSNKWFTEWHLDGLYNSDGKIIVGVENIVVNATLVDAYEVTVAVTDGGSYTMTTDGLNYAYERTANADGSRRFKVQAGQSLPTITASSAYDGYKYIGIANAVLNEEASSNTGYTYTTVVDRTMNIVVTYELKKYTVQFMMSDTTTPWTGHVYTNQIYTTDILDLVGGEWPSHLLENEQYGYTLNYWKVKVGGNYVQINDDDTIYSVCGNLADGTILQIVPEYLKTERYQLIIKNGSTEVYNEWHVSGEEIDLSTYTQSGKQFVYLSTSSTDNGRKTISDIGTNIFNVEYVYATDTVDGASKSYRQKYTGSNKATVYTMGTASITLYATFVDLYSVTMTYDDSTADTVRNNIVADTIVGLTQFETSANTALAPHHNVLLFSNSNGWKDSQIYNLGETASDASSYFAGADSDKYINPDGQIIVDSNITFTYVRRQISITVKIYTDATQVTSGVVDRQGLVVSGTSLLDAVYTYGTATEHVLPFYLDAVGQWSYSGISDMANSPWTNYQGGYTFVGYWLYKDNAKYKFYNRNGVGEYTLNSTTYTNNNIEDLSIISDILSTDGTVKLLCVWNLDNVAITIDGELPKYTNTNGDTTYTTVSLTYTTMVGDADCIATAQSVTTEINCDSTNKTVNIGYATEATMNVSVAEHLFSRVYLSFTSSSYLSNKTPISYLDAPASTKFTPTATDTISLDTSVKQMKVFFAESRDGNFGADADTTLVSWVATTTISSYIASYYGASVEFNGVDFTINMSDSTQTIVTAVLSNTDNYRIASYTVQGETAENGFNKRFDATQITITCCIERIYTINFDDNSSYDATNIPSTQVVGAYQDINMLVALDQLPTITGYTFKGWTMAEDSSVWLGATTTTYQLGKHYNDNASLTFKVVWEANIQTVSVQLKVYNADATEDITSSSTDIFFDNTSFTMRFDSTIQLTASLRNFSVYSGNGASMTTHSTLKNSITNGSGSSDKYEYLTHTVNGSGGMYSHTIKGNMCFYSFCLRILMKT